MKATIYHNPRCSKSRQTLELLKQKTQDIEIIEYLKNPLGEQELISIVTKLGTGFESIVRKKEEIFKDNYKDKKLQENDYKDAMLKFPSLMERPIVIVGNKAIMGRPPENVEQLF